MALMIEYDGTFSGFLSAVFDIYNEHLDVGDFSPTQREKAASLFHIPFRVEKSNEKYKRVKNAIILRANSDVYQLLEAAFRSENPQIEILIFDYLKKIFAYPEYGKNLAAPEVIPLAKIAHSVRHEAGEMLGMLRFTKTPDGIYIAEIEPKYDILPLMISHFKTRFSSLLWAILDLQRRYGVFFDGNNIHEVEPPSSKSQLESLPFDDFTQMWKSYYDAIAIKERVNPKLLKCCLPVRYWKHLPERRATQEFIAKDSLQNLPTNIAQKNAQQQILYDKREKIVGF